MIDSAVADLPEPDSPTSASVSPLRMSKETRSTASISRSPWPNVTDRSRTESSGDAEASMALTCRRSPESLTRVERVANGLADEDQERHHDGDGEESGNSEPRRLDVRLALLQH